MKPLPHGGTWASPVTGAGGVGLPPSPTNQFPCVFMATLAISSGVYIATNTDKPTNFVCWYLLVIVLGRWNSSMNATNLWNSKVCQSGLFWWYINDGEVAGQLKTCWITPCRQGYRWGCVIFTVNSKGNWNNYIAHFPLIPTTHEPLLLAVFPSTASLHSVATEVHLWAVGRQ